MAAEATYEPIATTTLSSDQNDITFSSITGTYTDLVIIVQAQSNATGTSSNGMRCRINTDSGNNYSYNSLYGDGAAGASGKEYAVNYFIPDDIPQTSATTRNLSIISIMDYANTTTFKTIVARGNWNEGTSCSVALWRSTAAITSVSISRNFFTDSTSKVKSGSIVSLYGIKAA
jgi:hypothetical protein